MRQKYSDSATKAVGVAGGTNKLNAEVKQLKGEIQQTTSGVQKRITKSKTGESFNGGY